jgi:hypothetical protein
MICRHRLPRRLADHGGGDGGDVIAHAAATAAGDYDLARIDPFASF